MAINHLIARKYARAAFGVAKNLGLLDQFFADLNKFANALSDAIIEELANPAISREDLAMVVAQMAQKLSLHEQVIKFLEVVAAARRINISRTINEDFAHLYKKEKKILEAEVFSVDKLSDDEIKSIKSVLEKKYNSAAVEITQTIKKDILGGVVVKIGSFMIDTSLKSQLINLEAQLQSPDLF
jgi:F-type H+-transporting ATPase subunit delta